MSSLTPWTVPGPLPQKRYSPCSSVAPGAYSRAFWMKLTGIPLIGVPVGGSNWWKSPTNRMLMPPNAWSIRCVSFFIKLTSVMICRRCMSNSAKKFALTILISSMINHFHWAMRCDAATFLSLSLFAAALFLAPNGCNPNAWCKVSPSTLSALTAWKAAIWKSTPAIHFSSSSKRCSFKILMTWLLPVPGPPCNRRKNCWGLFLLRSSM